MLSAWTGKKVRTSLDSLTGHVGGQIPLGEGSASHALLAFLPAAEAQAIIDANGSAYGRFGKLTAKNVLEQLPAIRERGYPVSQRFRLRRQAESKVIDQHI